MSSRNQSNSLTPTQRKRLRAALDQLPPSIAYLRDPILDLAKQDQDLLGAGDADTRSMIQALRQNTTPPHDVAWFAADSAEQLKVWLESQPDANELWAGPVWFAQGTLLGVDLFGSADAPDPPSPPPATGLQRVSIDLPPEFKVKLYAGGIELKARGVQIFVIELDDATYAIRLEGHLRPWPPGYPTPPNLIQEIINPFRIAQAAGIKSIARLADSGLPTMVTYLLALPTAKVEVGLFAKGRKGADLEKYEPLVASLRAK